MGCKQAKACAHEYKQNDRFYGQTDLPLVAGFNVFGGNWDTPVWIHKQCFPEDSSKGNHFIQMKFENKMNKYAWDGTM